MKKKEIEEYIKSKSVTQDTYVAPTVQTHIDNRTPAMLAVAQTVKPQKSVLDKVGYLGKNIGAGVLRAGTGTVDTFLQDIQSDLQKGAKRDKNWYVNNAITNLIGTLVPGGSFALNQIAKNFDKEYQKKNIGEKILENINDLKEATMPPGLKEAIRTYGTFDKEYLGGRAGKNVEKISNVINKPSEDLQKSLAQERKNYGKLLNYSGDVLQQVGYMAPSIATTAITKDPNLGLAAMGVGARGSSTREALEQGATLDQAINIGNAKAAIEVGTEKLTGGLNFFGQGALDDIALKGVDKAIRNKGLNFLAKQGLAIVGEQGEEVLADVLGTLIDKGTINPNANYTWDDLKNTLAQTAGSTVLLNLLGGSYSPSAYRQNALEMQNTNNTQNKGNTQTNTKNNINTQQTQENVLNNTIDSKNSTLDKVKNLNEAERQALTEITMKRKSGMSLDQNDIATINYLNNKDTATGLKGELSNVDVQIPGLEGLEGLETNQNINQNIQENIIPQTLQDSAIEYGFKGDSQELANIDNSLQKRGITARFDSSLFDNNNTNAIWINENGQRQVIFNPNASENTIVEEIAIHEMTHDIMSSENSRNALKSQEILNYAETLEGYKEARQNLEKVYSQFYDKNSQEFKSLVDEEIVADVLGRKLGNQEFINQLTQTKPSVARQIYNWVVDKVNSLINGGNKVRSERLYWQNIKNNFEKAYNMEYQSNSESNIKSSINTNEGLDNSSFSVVENYINEKGFELKNNGNLIVNNLTNKQINDLVKLYKTTGYDDVSSEYLKERLQQGNMPIMREVADRFIEKELGYKPKYDTTKIFEDSEGNKLSKEQVEFFKDSDVRDIRGRLIPVYHRTNSDFTVFDSKAGKQHGNKYGKGFYFSITPENYGNNTITAYLNAKEGEYKYIPSKGYYIVQNANQIKNIDNKTPTNNPDIRYSVSEKTTTYSAEQNNQLRDRAKSELGTTTNLNEAGYLTNDGEYLDFSGKKQGAQGGQRQMDHREISDIYSDAEYNNAESKNPNMGSATAVLQDFMERGNIRLNSTGIEIATPPTQEQYSKLYDYLEHVKRQNGEVFVDLDTETNNRQNLEYNDKTSISKIINDIKEHYNKSTADMRYSKGTQTWNNFLNENIKSEGTKTRLGDLKTTGQEGELYWKEQGADDKVAKILSEVPKEKTSLKDTANEVAGSLYRNIVSKGGEIEKIAFKTNKPNVNHTYDKMLRANAEAQQHIGDIKHKEGDGQRTFDYKLYKNFTDTNGNKVSMSLNDIRNDAKNSGISEQTLNEYLAHKLNEYRYEEGKPVFGKNITSEMSTETCNEIEKQHPEIKRIAGNVWRFEQNQLKNLYDSGLISEARYNELSKNKHYVRIQRQMPTNRGTKITTDKNGRVQVNQPIQVAKGGNQDIMPIMEGIAKYTTDLVKMERTNESMRELGKALGMGSTNENIDAFTDEESFGINPDLIKDNGDGTYSMTYFDKGVPTVVPINKGIYDAYVRNKAVSLIEGSKAFKTLSYAPKKISQVFRSLTTNNNPLFMATNFFKDIGDAPFNSKYTKEFAKTYLSTEALRQVAGNGVYNQLYNAAGGNSDSYFVDGNFTDKTTNKVKKRIEKLWSPVQKGNEIVETVPRVAEFIATIKANGYEVNANGELVVQKGVKPTKTANEVMNEALYNAAEITTNFKRGGDVAKSLNRNGATFLNASIQGFDKQIRNFKDAFASGDKKQIVHLLTKALIFGIAPTMLNDAANDDDDEYKEMPDYQKDNYYLFKAGDGKWIRIPKGRAMSVLGSAARRTKNFVQGDKNAYSGFVDFAKTQVAPNSIFENNILAPFSQVKNNKSWSGSKIIPDSIAKRPTEEQYNEKTDSFSKWLGQVFKDIPVPKEYENFKSPMAINYLIDQYTGAVGDVVLPMMAEKATSDQSPLIAPITSKFTVDSAYSNKSVSDFYDTKAEIEKKKNSVKATGMDTAKNSYMTSKNMQISNLYKEQREIQSNSSLSKKEKYKQAREVQKEINNLAKETVEEVKNAKKEEYYIKIGNYYYKKVRQNGKDTYVRDTSKKIPTEKYALYDYFKEKYEKSKESD